MSKLTEKDLLELIQGERYFRVEDTTLTLCILILNNGTTVTGESACIDPNNFNAETGRQEARKAAINKLWELEGYARKRICGFQLPTNQPTGLFGDHPFGQTRPAVDGYGGNGFGKGHAINGPFSSPIRKPEEVILASQLTRFYNADIDFLSQDSQIRRKITLRHCLSVLDFNKLVVAPIGQKTALITHIQNLRSCILHNYSDSNSEYCVKDFIIVKNIITPITIEEAGLNYCKSVASISPKVSEQKYIDVLITIDFEQSLHKFQTTNRAYEILAFEITDESKGEFKLLEG